MMHKDPSIALKLSKAKSLLAEIDVLMEHKFYVTAISRLYYSCFHATKALLLTKELIPKTHSGVVNLLHQHFVQSHEFDPIHASFFSRLMQERIEDDYSDAMIINKEEVEEFIEPARSYVAYVDSLTIKYLSA